MHNVISNFLKRYKQTLRLYFTTLSSQRTVVTLIFSTTGAQLKRFQISTKIVCTWETAKWITRDRHVLGSSLGHDISTTLPRSLPWQYAPSAVVKDITETILDRYARTLLGWYMFSGAGTDKMPREQVGIRVYLFVVPDASLARWRASPPHNLHLFFSQSICWQLLFCVDCRIGVCAESDTRPMGPVIWSCFKE